MIGKKWAVYTTFNAVDRISAPISRIQANINRLSRSTDRAFGRMKRSVKALNQSFRRNAGLTALATAGIASAIGKVVMAGADFEHSLVAAGARFRDELGRPILRGTEAFKELEDAAMSAGIKTEFTASQAGAALEAMSVAGLSAKEAIAALPGAIDLATASGTELNRASIIALKSLGAFGLMPDKALSGEERARVLAQNISRVNDALVNVITTSQTLDIEDLFVVISDAGARSQFASMAVEQFAAMIGILANSGVDASRAGTALKNILSRLAGPPSEAAAALKFLNVQITDLGNMPKIIDDINRAMDRAGLDAIGKSELIKDLFGQYGTTGALALLKEGGQGIRDYQAKLEAFQGSATKMATIMRDDVMGEVKGLTSAMQAFSITLFAVNRDAISKTIVRLRDWTREVVVLMDHNRELAASFTGNLLEAFIAVGKGFLLLVGLSFALGIAVNALTLALLLLRITGLGWLLKATTVLALTALGGAITWVAGTVSALAAAMLMAGMGVALFLGLIFLLVAAAAALIYYWEPVKQFFIDLWEYVTPSDETIARLSSIASFVGGIFSRGSNAFSGLGEDFGKFSGIMDTALTPPLVQRPPERSESKETAELHIFGTGNQGGMELIAPPGSNRFRMLGTGGM